MDAFCIAASGLGPFVRVLPAVTTDSVFMACSLALVGPCLPGP